MKHFRKTVDVLIKMMIPLVILALMMGIARIILDLRVVFASPTIAEGFEAAIITMALILGILFMVVHWR